MSGFDDIEFACLTDVGIRRSHNQDAHAELPAGDEETWRGRGHVFLVADGMGAHAVGELASKLAADSIPHIYSKHAQEGPVAALRKAFVETNLNIHTRGQQNREFEGMGTTATAILLKPEGLWIGHVGDSRCYRVRSGRIEQLSFDHSLVWEMARRQRKDPAELQGIPSNVIVRSLGPEPLVQVDVEGPHPVRPGDLYVLCSDGLSGPVTDREIGAAASVLPPSEACRFLIHLANLQGGPDNITAVIIRIGGVPPADVSANGSDLSSSDLSLPQPPARPLGHYWPFATLFLGIVLAIGAIVLTQNALAGGLPAFMAAAAALIAGLAGLLRQSAKERHEALTNPPGRIRVYRQTPCPIDDALLLKLAQAVQTLDERIRAVQGEADWDLCQEHMQQAEIEMQQQDPAAAFRERCRALLVLMEAVDRQRAKAEIFKPLWDRVLD